MISNPIIYFILISIFSKNKPFPSCCLPRFFEASLGAQLL